ncbi:hypothetical protein [Stenotrophomonas pigmentata]|uniref:hypothetical protein n=1 Tax=Stenotrophomonas pigmentata TaxID=3055080 RepID=UPI0026F24FDD|nr:hypothetical protein [Stenotrophomonas sp. 610A2]
MSSKFPGFSDCNFDWVQQCYQMCFSMLNDGLATEDAQTITMGPIEVELASLLDRHDYISGLTVIGREEEEARELDDCQTRIATLFLFADPNAIKPALLKILPVGRSMGMDIPALIPWLIKRGMRLTPEEAYQVMCNFGAAGPDTLTVLRTRQTDNTAMEIHNRTVKASAPARVGRL